MTYYGRWTYKFEEAARQGAAAALIIHDTEGASYGWDVVKNSWSGDIFPTDWRISNWTRRKRVFHSLSCGWFMLREQSTT